MKTSIIALHGFLGRSQDWKPVLAHCTPDASDGHRVWCPQLLSPDTAFGPDYTLKVWAALFNAAVAALTPPPRVLIGYSMGGRLALHAALQAEMAQPSLYSGLILLSTHPGIEDRREQLRRQQQDLRWAQRFLHWSWDALLKHWNAQPVFAGSGPPPPRRARDFQRQRLARALLQFSPSRHAFDREQLKTLRLPQLWLNGSRDEKYCALASRMENAGIIPETGTIAGLGHRLLPHGERVAGRIRRFLQSSSALA